MSVHDEIKAGKIRPKPWQGLLTVFIVFSASGFLHQFPMMYFMGKNTNYGQFLFFIIQAPLVLIERFVYRSLAK